MEGKVSTGAVSCGDCLDVHAARMELESATVKKIMSSDKGEKNTLMANEEGLILLEGKEPISCEKDDYLVKSGTVKVAKYFEATLDFFGEDEGGLGFPIKCNFKSQVFPHNA